MSEPGSGSGRTGPENEAGIAAAIRALVRTVVSSVGQAGTVSFSAIGDAAEGPGRNLAGRIATSAVRQPRPVAHRDDLAAALDEQPRSPLVGGATGAAVVAKVASRVGPLRFLARRTPMWLVVTLAPALHASVTRGAEELALVASHLVHRTREAGVEPDPERIRRATVHLLTGKPVAPDAEPRYAPLVVGWVRRALRSALPFAHGVATQNPRQLARAASAVDPMTLRATAPIPAASHEATQPE